MLYKSEIEKLAHVSGYYTFLGLISGMYFRQVTRYTKTDPHKSQLRALHFHFLSLGTLFYLLVMILEKEFELSKQKSYTKFFAIYNIGLCASLAMMTIRGTMTAVKKDVKTNWVAWTAGMSQGVLGLGLYYFYDCLSKAVKEVAK